MKHDCNLLFGLLHLNPRRQWAFWGVWICAMCIRMRFHLALNPVCCMPSPRHKRFVECNSVWVERILRSQQNQRNDKNGGATECISNAMQWRLLSAVVLECVQEKKGVKSSIAQRKAGRKVMVFFLSFWEVQPAKILHLHKMAFFKSRA